MLNRRGFFASILALFGLRKLLPADAVQTGGGYIQTVCKTREVVLHKPLTRCVHEYWFYDDTGQLWSLSVTPSGELLGIEAHFAAPFVFVNRGPLPWKDR